MKIEHIMIATALLALAAAGTRARADEAPAAPAAAAPGAPDPYEGLDAATKARLIKWDNGSDKIDVSAYPKEMQETYKTFSEKCSKCHTLARPINSDYALPDEWQQYVTKMSKKPRSGIHKKDVEDIVKFLSYDSSVRKKDLIERKLAARKAAPKADEKPAADEKAPAAKGE